MSIEIIKVIKETEEKAEIIKREAAQQAKQIISNANLEAGRILDEARELSESKSSEILKAAESEGQSLYDEIINKSSDECKGILNKAEENMDSAASIILERIVKTSVNS